MGRKGLCFSSYLVQRGVFFYFRFIIPPDLQEVLSIKELRYTLKTSDVEEAAVRAARVGLYVNRLIDRIRQRVNSKGLQRMDSERIKGLVQAYIQDMLEFDERFRIDRIKPFTWEELEAESYALSDFYDTNTEALARADLKKAGRLVDNLLEEHGITDITPDTLDYKSLAFELLKTNQVLARVFLARSEGNYEREHSLIKDLIARYNPTPQADNESGKKKTNKDSKKFSEIVKLIVEENKRTEAKSVRSVDDYSGSNELFIELMGDLPLPEIKLKTINEFLEKLKRWPKHRSKMPAYKDLSTEEILQLDIPIKDRISVTTINKHLAWVGHTLAFAAKRDYIAKNYCEGIKLTSKTKMRADEERAMFTKEDLEKLFSSREYLNDIFKHPYMFWLPILGLYTGARLGELCQLEVIDIQKIDDTWCLVIRPGIDEAKDSPVSREKKRIKAPSSRRSIPLHSFLLDDLKFLDFVQQIKDQGETRLFPDIPYHHDSYSQYVSRWFSKYRKRCGIVESNKTFHSFRHTFATNLKYQEVDFQIRGELEGHATGTAITDRYQKRFKADRLKRDGIDKLSFGIDLSHLRNSRFVIRGGNHSEY